MLSCVRHLARVYRRNDRLKQGRGYLPPKTVRFAAFRPSGQLGTASSDGR
jgi:hypothetical protein